MVIQHILVPTDFSEYADYALEYSIELAKVLQARLTLLHVFQLAPLTVGIVPHSVFTLTLHEMQTKAHRQIQATLARIKQTGIPCESVIVQGFPFQTIIDTVKERAIDLIVMGTHGRTGLTHVLMGSVAERVVRMAPCPVLVTRGRSSTVDT